MRCRTNPTLMILKFKAGHPEYQNMIPDYIKDYINLEKFAACSCQPNFATNTALNRPVGRIGTTVGMQRILLQFAPKTGHVFLGMWWTGVINQYKRICTINARNIHPDFAWQPRFHDRVIRDEIAYQNITKYIIDNPGNWFNDSFFP